MAIVAYLFLNSGLRKLQKSIKLEKKKLKKYDDYNDIRNLINKKLRIFIIFNMVYIGAFYLATITLFHYRVPTLMAVSFISIYIIEIYFMFNYIQQNRVSLRQEIISGNDDRYLELINLLIEKGGMIRNVMFILLLGFGIGFIVMYM